MRRVSPVDAAFLYGETASWHMHVSAVLVLDPPESGFDLDAFTDRVASRIHLAPQFAWKLLEVPFGLDLPLWVDDPDFDVRRHIRRIGVPPPGGPHQLGNLVGDLVSVKLDRGRPLWEIWVIEGLEGGRIALLAKIHHAIIDGVSGTELATVLLDLEPDPPATEPPEPGSEDLVPHPVELALRGVGFTLGMPFRVARFAGQTLRQGFTLLGFQNREVSPVLPFQAPRTPFNAELSPARRFAYTDVDLHTVRRVKDAFGVKVNDVVLALCAGTLRSYLAEHHEVPSTPLIAQVPVSLRAVGDNEVGTKVGAMFASLATDVDDPVERLLAIHRSTQGAKEMQRALAADKIMGLTETSPPGLIALASRMYTAAGLDSRTPPVMNLIISNVPGPPFPLYCGGAEVVQLLPMGPLLYGTGLNITVFSYRDRIGVGFLVCRDLVDRPWELADGIGRALDELDEATTTRVGEADPPDGPGAR